MWELCYEYKDKWLGLSLILHPFNSPLGPVYPQVLGPDNGARQGFHLAEGSLSPIRKWLATPMTFVTQLQSGSCLIRPVIAVTCRVQSWVRQVITFLLQFQSQKLLVLWNLSGYGWIFQVWNSLIFLCSITQVCIIFINTIKCWEAITL